MKTYWATPETPRHQLVLFAPSLDDMIGKDDPLRHPDAVVTGLDWSEYERGYDGVRGQPPIQPRYVAMALLYGVMKGLGGSRRLEEATRTRIDFMWLLHGQTIDHSTLCRFRTRFGEALAVARERDEAKRAKDGKNARAVQVPLSDPDASILPNKEGGYAPNYTPVAVADARTGLIVAAEVLADGSEAAAVQPLVEAVRQDHGTSPERILFDRGFASGANLAAMAQQGIEVYAPVDSPAAENHPAHREDPSQPLPPERIAALPRVKTTGQFERQAFLYDPQRNVYWCPMGRALPPHRELSRQTLDGPVRYTEYQSRDCEHCPLSATCLSRGARRRIVNRDQYEDLREATSQRMATDEARTIYRHRAPLIEGVFGCIQSAMGIRRFLLRGLTKVRTEWLWICTAFNLGKLLRFLADHAPAAPGQPIPPQPGGRPLRCRPIALHFSTPRHGVDFLSVSMRFLNLWGGLPQGRAA